MKIRTPEDFGRDEMPRFGDPVLSEQEITESLATLIQGARVEAAAEGRQLKKADLDALAFHHRASEAVVGPLTPEAVAGYFRRELTILTKAGDLVPFELRRVQWIALCIICDLLAAGVPVRLVVLKARQFGISTLVQALFFMLLARWNGIGAITIAHKGDATINIHRMIRRFWRYSRFKPKLSRMNASEMLWAHPWDNQMALDTAENKEAKRSFAAHLIHVSELAFWPYAETTRLGLMQTIGDHPNTIVVEESTANGIGNAFERLYWRAKEGAEAGTSKYRALFFPWFMHEDYQTPVSSSERVEILQGLDDEERRGVGKWGWSAEQIKWRRICIEERCNGDVLQFHQEYPSYDREAFLTSGRPVFDQLLLEKRREQARSAKLAFQGFIGYEGMGT